MVAGTFAGFGLTERAAVFLPGTIIVGGFAILVHSQSSRADRIAGRKRFQNLHTAWIERDKCLALIDRFYGVVDAFRVVALIREHPCKGRIWLAAARMSTATAESMMLALGGQLVERQPGNAVHQHMAFVSPVELVPPLIVLVGGRMDAEGTVQHR